MGLIERRITLLLALFLGLLALAGARTAYLAAIRAPSLKRVAASQQVRIIDVPAPRGTITDRHGIELAASEPADDVSANPKLIGDPVGVARRLAPLLGPDADSVARELADRQRGFVYLARRMPST